MRSRLEHAGRATKILGQSLARGTAALEVVEAIKWGELSCRGLGLLKNAATGRTVSCRCVIQNK